MDCYLVREEHVPQKPSCPAIDAHNHLWGARSAEDIVATMDAVGVVAYCDVSANTNLTLAEGGYVVEKGDIEAFFSSYAARFPGRFYCFTMATFARPPGKPLYDDPKRFVDETVAVLNEHVERGARGLKILKDLGLSHKDSRGRLIKLDDPELSPIWREAGRLGVPVHMHQSDPQGLFDPPTPSNEHYDTLKRYPSWDFSDPKLFPRKDDLLRRRDNVIKQHPETTFILPHVANFAENLGYVSKLLDENPNVYIDFSARLDELGRQPYTAREFFVKHQNRILFGTDMPANISDSIAMYRCYFRFLETFDEYFFAPDYDGTFGRHRWPIYGIGLPKDVLAKIYYRNVLRIVPGLREDLKNALLDGQRTQEET